MVIRKQSTGSLAPARQGHVGGGKLVEQHAWVRQRLLENGDLTLAELRVELEERGVSVDRSTVCQLF